MYVRAEETTLATRAQRTVTSKEFMQIDFGSDARFELIDGVIYGMTGGTSAHARVQANVLAFLHRALRGSGCRPYGPDMALELDEKNVRYPDVTVYCGNPGRPENDRSLFLTGAVAVFEILSPSTRSTDLKQKPEEYQGIASIDTIVFIDPDTEWMRIVQRLGPEAWHDEKYSGGADVILPTLGLTLPKSEIFSRD